MTKTQPRAKLPPESDDNVVEVDLRHVVLAFGTVVTAIILTGTALVIIKDYAKYRRQRAVIEAVSEFIQSIKKGEKPWKDKTEVSSSEMKTLKPLPKH